MATERFRGLERSAAGTLGGFRTFILRGNVVDLAVGIVIGAAFGAVVNSLVSNVITPLIPVPGGSLASWKIHVSWTNQFVQIGAFINAIISFIILAFVIYYFVVLTGQLANGTFQTKGCAISRHDTRMSLLSQHHSTPGDALPGLHITGATDSNRAGSY